LTFFQKSRFAAAIFACVLFASAFNAAAVHLAAPVIAFDVGIQASGQSVYLELLNGELTQVTLSIKNTLNSSSAIAAAAQGPVAEFVSFEESTLQFMQGQERSYRVIVRVPPEKPAGLYSGEIIFSDGVEQVGVPVSIRVLSSNEQLLDIKIQPLTDAVAPGDSLRSEYPSSTLARPAEWTCSSSCNFFAQTTILSSRRSLSLFQSTTRFRR
jgi:hypothetical protein